MRTLICCSAQFASGPSRHFTAMQCLVSFLSKADLRKSSARIRRLGSTRSLALHLLWLWIAATPSGNDPQCNAHCSCRPPARPIGFWSSAFWPSAKRCICATWRSRTPPCRSPVRAASRLGCAARSGCRSCCSITGVRLASRSPSPLLNLLRPSIVLVALALAAAAFGVVLHNVDLSALAVGVLILSLARPAPAPE